MNILLVTPSYFPIIGGSEALTRTLCTKLNEVGIHTDIMTFNMDKKWYPLWEEDTKKEGSYNVFRMPAFNPFAGAANYLDALFKINVFPKPSFISRLKQYDVIHFIGEADLSIPVMSYFVRKPKIMQCVGTYRGGFYKYYTKDHPLVGQIFRKFFANLADTYLVSSIEQNEILSDLGVPKSKIMVLPIVVDTETFHPEETRKLNNLVLFVGRIERIKGLHLLMKALSYLKISAQVAIIGPKWNTKYVEEIEQMSQAINKDGFHKVKLLGAMDQKSLVPWYQKATVLVSPYLIETYSNVTREALACGTPVVSTGPHILKDGSDGIMLTPKNPEKLAEAIQRLLVNKQLRKKYGREGRKLIEQQFSWKSTINELIKVYKKMLRRTSKDFKARVSKRPLT